MTAITLRCYEIDFYSNYAAVSFDYEGTGAYTSSGIMTVMVPDGNAFEIGSYYDLNMNKVA